jgi:hypothetical protein
MQKPLIAMMLAGALSLAGCAGFVPQDKPALSVEAQTALLQAEQDIKFAESRKGDTTAARKSYQQAQEAAAKGDEAAAIKHAWEASQAAVESVK